MKPVPTDLMVRTIRKRLLAQDENPGTITKIDAETDTKPDARNGGKTVGHAGRGCQLSILVADDNTINQDVARAINARSKCRGSVAAPRPVANLSGGA